MSQEVYVKFLYERIYEDLRRQIEEGELRPGERLPSVRETAEQYDCNKLTAVRAFDLLKSAGLVDNIVGSGSFVRFPLAREDSAADFGSSILSEDFFPYEDAGVLFAEELKRERGRVFSAAPVKGESRLINSIARRFSLDGDSVWVASGGQQGLDSANRLFRAIGRTDFLVEDPTYPAALSLFRPAGGLVMRDGGVDPEEFDHFWKKRSGGGPGVFYTMPDVHNPTGFCYSAPVKRRIAELARLHDVWIIEDDYLSELEPTGIPRFADLAPERTIWIKSLSKTTAPGIRVCAMSVPGALASRYAAIRSETDPGPAMWLQLFTERLLSSGIFDLHLGRITAVMKSRRKNLDAVVSATPGIRNSGGTAGYNVWLTRDTGGAGEKTDPARGSRPAWTEGSRFGSDPATRRSFRVSFMGIPEAEWPQAVRRLSHALGATPRRE